MLRRMFGRKGQEVAGGWRTLLSEELRNLYASPNIRVIKSGRVRWAAHVARVGAMRHTYKILVCKT